MQPSTLLVATAALLAASTLTHTASAFEPGSGNRVMWENDCDFYGDDRYAVRAGGERCGDLCADDGGCSHWTWTDYEGGTCWLKNGGAHAKNGFGGAACGYVIGRTADPNANGAVHERVNTPQYDSVNNGLSADETNYMLYLINEYRRQNGRAALTLNVRLTAAANVHSQEQALACTMGHNSLDGSDFSVRISASGYDWASVRENVAAGQWSVVDVVSAWWNSPPHRENMLDDNVAEVGFAKGVNDNCGNYQIYWTQDFGRAM